MDDVILCFTAKWCGPCRQMQPIIEEHNSKSDVKVKKIDVDEEADMSLKYNISGIPTFVRVLGGKEISRKVGAVTMNELSKLSEV